MNSLLVVLNKEVEPIKRFTLSFKRTKANPIKHILTILNKGKKLPIGTVREWKGGRYKKIAKRWVQVAGGKKEGVKEISALKSIPVEDLNKGIDFKANEKFLNDEIKSAAMPHEEEAILDREVLKKYEEMLRETSDERIRNIALKGIKSVKKNIKKLEKVKINLKEYKQFAQNLTPVHSLSIDKFIKVLKSGGLKALSELEKSGKQNGYAIIESEIRPKFGDVGAEIAITAVRDNDFTIVIGETERLYKAGIKHTLLHEYDKMFDKLRDIEEESKAGAVGYSVDEEIGTNKHVFSIMGPNGNGSGYGEISIVMKQDIMKHPDFNMTPTAGTSFVSGEMYSHREWTEQSKEKQKQNEINRITEQHRIEMLKFGRMRKNKEDTIEQEKTVNKLTKDLKKVNEEFEFDNKIHFHKSKLNAKENSDYAEYMAKDIAAQGSIDEYLDRSSHGKWEAHLPSTVLINMFQEIIMTKETKHRLEDQYLTTEYKNWKSFSDKKREKLYAEIINKFNSKLKNIKLVDTHDDILPYMSKSFKSGEWKFKKESEQKGKKPMKSKHTLTYEKPILTLGVPAQHLMTIDGHNLEPIEKGKALGIGTIRTHGGKKMKKTSKGWVPVSSKQLADLSKRKETFEVSGKLKDFIKKEIKEAGESTTEKKYEVKDVVKEIRSYLRDYKSGDLQNTNYMRKVFISDYTSANMPRQYRQHVLSSIMTTIWPQVKKHLT